MPAPPAPPLVATLADARLPDAQAGGAGRALPADEPGTFSAAPAPEEPAAIRPAYLFGSGSSGTEANGDARFRASIEGAYLSGPVEGQLQTPTGGQPGTASPGRPTLDELGIDDASLVDAAAAVGWGEHEIYVGGQWIQLAGDRVLGETLISRGKIFPAGTVVESDVQLDWYRAGYRHRFDFGDGPGGAPAFLLKPSVGAALLDFEYQLDAGGGGDGAGPAVDRSYAKAGLQLGLEGEWRATERFSVAAGVLCSVPLSNTPSILSAALTGRYRVVQHKGVDVIGFVGVAYEQIHYQDEQELPNDIEVDLGPLLMLGVEVKR